MADSEDITPLKPAPSKQRPDAELISATEAMERAAKSMLAVTELFRKHLSLSHNDTEPGTSSQPVPETSISGDSSARNTAMDARRISPPVPVGYVRDYRPAMSPAVSPRDSFPPQRPPSAAQTDHTRGGQRQRGSIESDFYVTDLPRTGDWQSVQGGSTPTLAGTRQQYFGLYGDLHGSHRNRSKRNSTTSTTRTYRATVDGSAPSSRSASSSRGHSRRRSTQQGEELFSSANHHHHNGHQRPPLWRSRSASQGGTRRPDSAYQGRNTRLPRDIQGTSPATIQVGSRTYIRKDWPSDSESEFRKEKPPGRHLHQQLPPSPERRKRRQSRGGSGNVGQGGSNRGSSDGRHDSPRGQPGGPPLTLWHEVAFVAVIAAAQALMLSGVSQALIPATVIGESFGLRRSVDLSWFSAAYALTSGTFVLPAGRLGDLFGHKRIFVLGFFWFAAASLACGLAPRVHAAGANGVIYFNVMRALQGIGPALQVPNGQAMLGRAYSPGPRKALVMSLFGAAAPFGFVVGGVMASLFAQLATWPWAFYTLAAVCLVLGALSFVVLPSEQSARGAGGSSNQGPQEGVEGGGEQESLWVRLDIAGIVLAVSGLVLFNFTFNRAAEVTWSTPYIYFILIISLLLLTGFVYVEGNAAHPLLPLAAMGAQTNFVLACTAAGWGCFSVWVFYSFQFLEVLRGWTPLLAAGSHGPGPVTGLIASLLVAKYIMRVGAHWIMLLSMLSFLTGSVLMATAPVDQPYWANTLWSVLVMPFGMDMSNPAATILLSNAVPREHQGIAASLVVTVVNYSISTALGFAATVETSLSRGETAADVLAGFRSAQYFGIGLGALGVTIALAFSLRENRRTRTEGRDGGGEKARPPRVTGLRRAIYSGGR